MNLLRAGALSAAFVVGPLLALSTSFAQAAVVTSVYNTLPYSAASGMVVGQYFQGLTVEAGIQFRPTTSGYFSSFTFAGVQSPNLFPGYATGTSPWSFSLYADSSGAPGTLLETISSVSVSTAAQYNVTAASLSLLTTGQDYWLMATLPSDSSGVWLQQSSATPHLRCARNVGTVSGCAGGLYNDVAAGAVQIFVSDTRATADVPEPGTLALVGISVAGLAAMRRRKQ